MLAGFCGIRLPAPRLQQAVAQRPARLCIQARYRGQGTDLTRVPEFKTHPTDTGSSEVQIAQLTARVNQLTSHLQQHKKDYSSTRGLMRVLSQRKQLMKYLYRTDPSRYLNVIRELKIRPLKVQAGRNLVIRLEEGAVAQKVEK